MSQALVLQTDFGLSDGAVNAMNGVAFSVDVNIPIFNLTHDIPPYDIWAGSYRLLQTVTYWPEETVFVSVVDPGVGSDRKSVVVKTNSNQYIVTPDNGTLTHIQQKIGIKAVRIIDEEVNRLPQSGASHTFHGRDVYAYTGARLASGVISFEEVGPELPLSSVVTLPFIEAEKHQDQITGIIDILDVRFGNLWTNISRELFLSFDVQYGDTLEVTILQDSRKIYKNLMTYGRSFADICVGEPLVYVNSLDNLAVAINQGSFAKAYNIGTGSSWRISIRKAPKIIYN
ncbi:S-adenosyl-l-methionine hydroxide adenosyltransferase family protein [Radiobacillus kanasensis]|uniref:SAM hydrolase/SAM-dependent halogenase family protein n=1 Tax=Radiobacillus kanasensis TaxID=2844358 RepID=UPI001E316B15|nr:S-adenosyl-l-methionine hydroxide adenosyltransferase family protein [Radiobacillus kanasensis]UFT98333.1 S-adenosyl-l-methionine hydroxide adenosyltransferase family protein [Radiobacillus kanasensis]